MAAADDGRSGTLQLCLAVGWIATLPTLLLAIHPLFASVPVLKPDRVAFLLAIAPLLATAVRNPRSLQRPGAVEAAMAFYGLVIAVSWITTWRGKNVAAIKADSDFLLTSFVMPFAAFLIARNVVWTECRMRACIWVLVGGVATYLMLYGAAQYLFDWGALVPPELKQMTPDRAQGPFENAVPYGVVLSLYLPLLLFLFLHAATTRIRVILTLIALGILQGIVGSKTRSVWLALPIAMLIPILRASRLRHVVALMLALLVAEVLLAPRLGLDFWGLKERLTQVTQVYDRVAVTATATSMVAERPLFGFGFGMSTFNDDKGDYYTSWAGVPSTWAVYPNNPHNDVLNVLVMMGAIGLVAYVALMAVAWLLLWRVQQGSPSAFGADLATAVQAMFLIVVINGLFHSVMHMAYVQTLFFFVLGMAGAVDAFSAAELSTRRAAA